MFHVVDRSKQKRGRNTQEFTNHSIFIFSKEGSIPLLFPFQPPFSSKMFYNENILMVKERTGSSRGKEPVGLRFVPTITERENKGRAYPNLADHVPESAYLDYLTVPMFILYLILQQPFSLGKLVFCHFSLTVTLPLF